MKKTSKSNFKEQAAKTSRKAASNPISKAEPADVGTKLDSVKAQETGASQARPRQAGPVKAAPAISLELVKPEAHQVFVAGSFNHWRPESTPLQKSPDGRWVGNLAVTPGRHEYLFVVDGQWMPDPNAKEHVSNPFGGKNSVISVSA